MHLPLSRRGFLLASTGAAAALAAPPAQAAPRPRPFGRYGSPAARLTPGTLYVDPHGRGDHTTVQAAVTAATGTGRTLVLAPGTYRETVSVDATRTDMTWLGAGDDPRDVVIVYDNAAGTPKPDGSGTYGTSGSATTTVRADGFTAHRITFANDWLRADHPGVTGTQAVALKVMGDRSAFHHCRFLGHQDTLYADTTALSVFARQYFAHCYAEGDVDFVFGRATAVFEHCHFHTLTRTDLTSPPYGFVFAPSTAGANPRGYLVTKGRVTSEAPDGSYKLARPWVPSSDTTARPMLTVRDTWLGPGIDAVAPYANMSSSFPWQEQRFAEYRNTGPGARITAPENRPQLTADQAASANRAAWLGGWEPWKEDC
ncbi:pectinesterase [Streptomyces sp. NBRC 14336]|uniref:pectinesterase family protein n=1 Tax=Streptomyces sp. NBRC 14336 TaxID=3030992 RepID=UPI0024A589C9|nr:pectinesterase family protein [Streptomyces sp. NBRC 14336]WBO77217.1 pectinesterase family protein [Streptomyces sp. SBE_14.2]GLW50399.1 pectinesterase [Streptomyces sp. NBRC 14336]